MIPYARTLTVTHAGRVFKTVACQGCGQEYVYLMDRESTRSDTSTLSIDNQDAQDRADQEAAKELTDQLENKIDVVPCPACGTYQDQMIKRAREEFASWCWSLSIGLFMLGASIGFLALVLSVIRLSNAALENGGGPSSTVLTVLWLSTICSVFLCFVIIRLRSIRSKHHDPNNQPQFIRRELGRQRACLKKEFNDETSDRLIMSSNEKQASKRGYNHMRAGCVSFAFAGLATYLIIGMFIELYHGTISKNWPTTQAIIDNVNLASKTTSTRGIKIVYYYPEIQYRYVVDGEKYSGDRVRFCPVKSRNQQEITSLIDSIYDQSPLIVHYQSDDPSLSVLLPGLDTSRYVLFTGLCIVIPVALIFGAIRIRKFFRLRSVVSD